MNTSTYNPQYIADLVNRQLSLIAQKVEQGIITHSQAINTMALIQDGVSEALSNMRTHLDARIVDYCKNRIDSMPTVEVVEHGKHHEGCGFIDHTSYCKCDREADPSEREYIFKRRPFGHGGDGWNNRIEEEHTCVDCNGKGRVWHPGCGDTDESCIPCEGTGFDLDMRVY